LTDTSLPKREAFWKAQNELCCLLRARPKPKPPEPDRRWIITDLVTLGSPLTHAEFLLAKSAENLEERKVAREYPASPPNCETQDPDVSMKAHKAGLTVDPRQRRLFCYPVVGSEGLWQLDHGAPFAVVRWTNIHDPARFIFCGDIISGPVAPAFGPGVRDVDLRRESRRQSRRFSHTKYWSDEPGSAKTPVRILELRRAMDLIGRYL
jgi:hypothetical protein